MTSIPDLLRQTAQAYNDNPVVLFPDRSVSFAEVDSASDHIAAALTERGIRKGDRVGLYCINSEAFAIIYCGIVKAGAVVVPVNLLLNPKEIRYILQDVADLLGIEQQIDRHHHRTRLNNAAVDDGEGFGVDAVEAHPITLADTPLRERGGDVVRGAVYLGKTYRAVGKKDYRVVVVSLGGLAEKIRNGGHDGQSLLVMDSWTIIHPASAHATVPMPDRRGSPG